MNEFTSIRVAVVEDQQLFRDLLVTSLGESKHIQIVSQAGTVRDARALIQPGQVDVAILDVELPDGNGLGLGLSLKRADPHLAVVTLSVLDLIEPYLGIPATERGTWSYLSKSSAVSIDALIDVVRRTAQGESVIDPSLLQRSTPRPGSSVSSLTTRQFEVLRMVARGLSNQSIAETLGIASNSVVNHLSAIYATLGVGEGQNARVSATLEFLSNTQRSD
jgi:DNA-binding NarL/FixJ family response regulator